VALVPHDSGCAALIPYPAPAVVTAQAENEGEMERTSAAQMKMKAKMLKRASPLLHSVQKEWPISALERVRLPETFHTVELKCWALR
jgi:hypothetical protein